MSIEKQLIERSGGVCEITGNTENLIVHAVAPKGENDLSGCVYITQHCANQADKKAEPDAALLNALKSSIWSEVPAVQVLSWRMVNSLRNEPWAMELLDTVYLDDESLKWAQHMEDTEEIMEVDIHKDCNGAVLQTGDSIVLIKSLDVKGSAVNARIGTVVKNIRIVSNNTDQIEGKIDGQQIVILTKYVRRQQ